MPYFTRDYINYIDNLDSTYTLQEDLDFVDDNGDLISVPTGFTFDGATIPRFFWRLCGPPMHHENVRAACVHDFIYTKKRLPRKKCDSLFYDALIIEGKNSVIAKLMYCAVRLFGRSHY